MQTLKTMMRPAILLLVITAVILSCKKEINTSQSNGEEPTSMSKKPLDPGFAENDMVMLWNDRASTVLRLFSNPPSHSRAFAMIQIAVHDALNSIKPKYERFALTNERDQFASPDAAVASAAYWTIKGMNLQGSNPVDDWYNQSLATIPDGASKEAGKLLGKKSAEAIIAKRSTDNWTLVNVVIAVPDGINPGEYKSTLPFSNPGMPKLKGLPQWGTLMPGFVVPENDQFRPSPPYAVSSAEYTADYNEIKSKGAMVGHTRTADENKLVTVWVGERFSSSWNRFARSMVSAKKLDAWKTARLFALLHTSMIDAITGSFEAKYHYFSWRAETFIRLGDNDGNNNTVGDANWLPGFIEIPNLANPALHQYSPPLPAYPSGSASYPGAATEILRLFFGSDVISVDQTNPSAPGTTLHYSSLSNASRDAALSRMYAGHYTRYASLKGEEQGVQIANYVFNHAFRENGE